MLKYRSVLESGLEWESRRNYSILVKQALWGKEEGKRYEIWQ